METVKSDCYWVAKVDHFYLAFDGRLVTDFVAAAKFVAYADALVWQRQNNFGGSLTNELIIYKGVRNEIN